MKNEKQKDFCSAVLLLITFLLWTVAVRTIGVQAIGPQQSSVGFGPVNRFVHEITGVNMGLYYLTDRLSIIPLGIAALSALAGLVQWIKRKNILKVDCNILALGVFYTAVLAVYIFFEIFVVNYRPVLIYGVLEASYPSSTTVLVICVMSAAKIQLDMRIRNCAIKCLASNLIILFTVFMVICRLVSGVHWFTDIVGGVLLSTGLVLMYRTVTRYR